MRYLPKGIFAGAESKGARSPSTLWNDEPLGLTNRDRSSFPSAYEKSAVDNARQFASAHAAAAASVTLRLGKVPLARVRTSTMNKPLEAVREPAVEIRFGQVGLAQVRIRTTDAGVILDELTGRVASAPQFFERTAPCAWT